MSEPESGRMDATIKRMIDLASACAGVLFLSPLLALVALLIKQDSPGPVFYRGTRAGRGGRPFQMLKFRTMVVNPEERGPSSTAVDDPRITRVGAFLRRYKLDELPQLLNVLKGEMSLVGPRPQIPWAVDLYTPEEQQLLTVRPGITDYASLRFSNESEILRGSSDPDKDYMERIHPEKVRLGLEYVRTRSLWVDLKIICLTVLAVLGVDGWSPRESR